MEEKKELISKKKDKEMPDPGISPLVKPRPRCSPKPGATASKPPSSAPTT